MASHALLGGALAYINGGNVGTGAGSAVAAESIAEYLTQPYKDKSAYQNANGEFEANRLPEDVKAQIRDLSSAIGGVVGGVVGDSLSNAQIGGVIGQNAVENNASIAGVYAKKKSEQYNDLCKQSGISIGQCSEWTGQRIINNSKELAMIIVPTEIYEVIPVGKGYGVIEKGSKKIIVTVKDSKQVKNVLENIKTSQVARESSKFKEFSESAKIKYFENITNKNFFDNAKYTSKVEAQIVKDNYHGFPKTIDELAKKYGKTSVYTGSGDGVPRLKLEVEGSYNGRKGTFEYIQNLDGSINHRLFVPQRD